MDAAAQGGHAGLLGEGLHQSQLNLRALQQNSDINRSWTRTISRSSFQKNAKCRFFFFNPFNVSISIPTAALLKKGCFTTECGVKQSNLLEGSGSAPVAGAWGLGLCLALS